MSVRLLTRCCLPSSTTKLIAARFSVSESQTRVNLCNICERRSLVVNALALHANSTARSRPLLSAARSLSSATSSKSDVKKKKQDKDDSSSSSSDSDDDDDKNKKKKVSAAGGSKKKNVEASAAKNAQGEREPIGLQATQTDEVLTYLQQPRKVSAIG